MLEVIIQLLIHPLTVHPATVVLVHHSYQFIRWKAVIRCYQLQPLMDLTINHGRGRTPVGMRLTWNRTQVQPNEGTEVRGRLGNHIARTDYVRALVRATYCSP